jgi:hypothetical protein
MGDFYRCNISIVNRAFASVSFVVCGFAAGKLLSSLFEKNKIPVSVFEMYWKMGIQRDFCSFDRNGETWQINELHTVLLRIAVDFAGAVC